MPKSTKSEIWMCKIDQNRAPTAQNRALTAQNRLQTLKICKTWNCQVILLGHNFKNWKNQSDSAKTSQNRPKLAKSAENPRQSAQNDDFRPFLTKTDNSENSIPINTVHNFRNHTNRQDMPKIAKIEHLQAIPCENLQNQPKSSSDSPKSAPDTQNRPELAFSALLLVILACPIQILQNFI